jgi:hypothetical protein
VLKDWSYETCFLISIIESRGKNPKYPDLGQSSKYLKSLFIGVGSIWEHQKNLGLSKSLRSRVLPVNKIAKNKRAKGS